MKYREAGVYCSSRAYRTLVVVTDRLPVVEETLFVRIVFSDLAGMREAWRTLDPEWLSSPAKRALGRVALDYWRHIEATINPQEEKDPPKCGTWDAR